MDKAQADAIAQVLLERDVREQEELRGRRAAETVYRARKRRVARFTLVGFGLGAVAAYLGNIPLITGFTVGGIAGTTIGWLVTQRSAV